MNRAIRFLQRRVAARLGYRCRQSDRPRRRPASASNFSYDRGDLAASPNPCSPGKPAPARRGTARLRPGRRTVRRSRPVRPACVPPVRERTAASPRETFRTRNADVRSTSPTNDRPSSSRSVTSTISSWRTRRSLTLATTPTAFSSPPDSPKCAAGIAKRRVFVTEREILEQRPQAVDAEFGE